jgi:hypothetical protein
MGEAQRRTSSALFFWGVCFVILAVILAAMWDTFVIFVGPFIEAVRDTYLEDASG